MKLRAPRLSLVLGLAALSSLGVAGAQPAPSAGPAPGIDDIQAPQAQNLSPAQHLAQGQQAIQRMDQAGAVVRAMLEQAREARDVVKVLCLNDKLNQIDVAIRSGRDRVGILQTAAQAGNAERARHEGTVLLVLRDRVEALVAEANQCIGEETGFIGDAELTVNVDPTIPATDPAVLGSDPVVLGLPGPQLPPSLDPPRVTSPTL